jgi:hypothetical protein
MTGTLILIAITIFIIWMIYAGWSAPLMKQNEDGSFTTIRPERKLTDLFGKKNEEILEVPDNDFHSVEAFQKLAGIKPVAKNDILRETLSKNTINGNKIVEALMKAAENSDFPAPQESMNVRTERITTIDLNSYEEKDPLASVPMSRVSNEAKQKMAEIAKADINKQLETQTSNLHPALKAEFEKELEEANKIVTGQIVNDQRLGVEFTKPKRKYTKRKTK